ncbi:UNVERIFIED_CONTAM: hypothetical protein HDU68_012365 [Siphonaria sp. JEL0065]|nr:hypothetical protein HDU68_012365 [Siphonaria sp. JEL0065]
MPSASNVRVYVRRPLYPNEANSDENRMPGQIPGLNETEGDPYRVVDEKSPLMLNELYTGTTASVYGVLVFHLSSSVIKKQCTIDLLMNGIAETSWMNYGFMNYAQSEKFFKFKSMILDQNDPIPEPNAEGDVVLKFGIIIRTEQQLPITFKSQSADIKYSMSFKFINKDIFNTTIEEFAVPVQVGPSWVAAPPPDLPLLHAEDDGIRVVLDLEGEIQGNTSILGNAVAADANVSWLRPRLLNNIEVSNNLTPAYSEIDEGTTAESSKSSQHSNAANLGRKKSSANLNLLSKRSFSDLVKPGRRKLHPSISQESMVVPVSLNDPLPYAVDDPLSYIYIHPHSMENLASASEPSTAHLHQANTDLEIFLARSSSESESPRRANSFGLNRAEFNINDTSELHLSLASLSLAKRPSFFKLPSRNNSEFSNSGNSNDKKPPVMSSQLDSVMYVPQFRIVVPCTMAGPGSLLPVQIHIQSLPPLHTAKYLEVILQASVKCSAMGSTKIDAVPFVKKTVEFASVESIPLQKQIELQVPESDKMGMLGVGFKAPLIELSHQIIFCLHTEYKGKRGSLVKTAKFELGSVSLELMR